MANAFFVRCDCRNRRFTGGKSRFLQEADGRKGIASAANELCGIALGFAAHRRGAGCCLREFRASADARVPFPQGKGTKGCRGPARIPCGAPAPGPPSCKRLVSVEPRRGAPNGVPSGSALTAPLKTFRFQRGPVLREGKSWRGEIVLRTWRFFYTWSAYKKPPLKGEVPAKRAEGFRPPRRKVAAALSAAVTTTKPIRNASTSQAEPSKRKGATQAPPALRERGSGGEALLSEKRPLPQRLPLPRSPLPLLHLLFELGEFLGCIALKGASAGHHHEPCADHETHGAAEEKLVHAITSLRGRVRG